MTSRMENSTAGPVPRKDNLGRAIQFRFGWNHALADGCDHGLFPRRFPKAGSASAIKSSPKHLTCLVGTPLPAQIHERSQTSNIKSVSSIQVAKLSFNPMRRSKFCARSRS